MTIIVETGAIVSGANSYISANVLSDYACNRGIDLTVDPDILIFKSMDYLESFSDRFKGERVNRDQALSWPRTDVIIENWYWNSSEIPRQVMNAQLALCIEINVGEDPLNPSIADLPVIRERVEGAVEVEYANPGQALKVSKTQPSRTLINLLLRNSGLFAIRA